MEENLAVLDFLQGTGKHLYSTYRTFESKFDSSEFLLSLRTLGLTHLPFLLLLKHPIGPTYKVR